MKNLSENRRARFDYDVGETLEAGIELLGTEVKSVKESRMHLDGSYAVLRGEEVWLVNADIPPYQPKNAPADYDSKRSRRLLLHREETRGFAAKLKGRGVTLIPLRAYLKHGLIKIELGLGRARKAHDKRELLKERAVLRETRKLYPRA